MSSASAEPSAAAPTDTEEARLSTATRGASASARVARSLGEAAFERRRNLFKGVCNAGGDSPSCNAEAPPCESPQPKRRRRLRPWWWAEPEGPVALARLVSDLGDEASKEPGGCLRLSPLQAVVDNLHCRAMPPPSKLIDASTTHWPGIGERRRLPGGGGGGGGCGGLPGGGRLPGGGASEALEEAAQEHVGRRRGHLIHLRLPQAPQAITSQPARPITQREVNFQGPHLRCADA
mmetsp:Transcript_56482/g.183533  ORF Transcript_56482/g.183533 Transcript_56482/m.183533 type:complete len:235 (-) Transcript_56482:59-763(-)